MKGRLVKTLLDASMQQGNHQLVWNANDDNGHRLAAGIYFLRLYLGNYSATKNCY